MIFLKKNDYENYPQYFYHSSRPRNSIPEENLRFVWRLEKSGQTYHKRGLGNIYICKNVIKNLDF